MGRKTEPIKLTVHVRYVDKNTLPPEQAVARAKAMRLFEKIFRKAEERARREEESKDGECTGAPDM